jgi:hypothetical protein
LEAQVPTDTPDGTGLVDYKREYEKAKVRLDSLKKQTDEAKKVLAGKEEKILQLGKQIEGGRETLLALKGDLKTGESDPFPINQRTPGGQSDIGKPDGKSGQIRNRACTVVADGICLRARNNFGILKTGGENCSICPIRNDPSHAPYRGLALHAFTGLVVYGSGHISPCICRAIPIMVVLRPRNLNSLVVL